MFRPSFIEPDNMLKLGFELVKDEEGYLQYKNNGKVHWNKDYNKECPEPKGRVVLFINTTYSDKYFYIGIEQDWGSRKVYGGVCSTESFLIELLSNIR
jgi:hypothetical protein